MRLSTVQGASEAWSKPYLLDTALSTGACNAEMCRTRMSDFDKFRFFAIIPLLGNIDQFLGNIDSDKFLILSFEKSRQPSVPAPKIQHSISLFNHILDKLQIPPHESAGRRKLIGDQIVTSFKYQIIFLFRYYSFILISIFRNS